MWIIKTEEIHPQLYICSLKTPILFDVFTESSCIVLLPVHTSSPSIVVVVVSCNSIILLLCRSNCSECFAILFLDCLQLFFSLKPLYLNLPRLHFVGLTTLSQC